MKLGQGNENHQLSISGYGQQPFKLYLAQGSVPPVILGFLSDSSSALNLCFTLFKHKPTFVHLYKWYTSSSAPRILEKAILNITMRPESYEDLRLKPNSCFILLIVQQYSFIATLCCLMYASLQELQGRGHHHFLYVYTVPTTTQ